MNRLDEYASADGTVVALNYTAHPVEVPLRGGPGTRSQGIELHTAKPSLSPRHPSSKQIS